MYNQPLNEDSMEAILQLTEVAIEQKKKKGKTNKNEISKEKKKKLSKVTGQEAKAIKKIARREKEEELTNEIKLEKKKKRAPTSALP
jgi:hypothetical protein